MSIQKFMDECTRLTSNMQAKLAASKRLALYDYSTSSHVEEFLNAQQELHRSIRDFENFLRSSLGNNLQA